MAVDEQHPEYRRFSGRWQVMRDTSEGTERVKEQGSVYLPVPSGMKDARGMPTDAYDSYKERAVFPEIVAPTIRGLAGTIHRKDFTYNLPTALDPLRERATRDGLGLEALHRRLTMEILQVGRMGLLVDVPSRGRNEPFLADYRAETIINWDHEGTETTFVVLDETDFVRDPQTYQWDEREQWRVLTLEDGRYVMRVLTRTGEGVFAQDGDDIEPVSPDDAALDFIPFTFVDANDLTPDPDEVPLIGLGRKAVDIYRLEADYRLGLFMAGQETLLFFGVEEDDMPERVGATVVHGVGNPEARAEYVGPNGGATDRLRQAIVDDLSKASQQGARMFESAVQRQAESGEALRIRRATETATLQTIAQNTAAGLQQALRHAAVWIGANPDEVEVIPPDSLVDEKLTPTEIDALVRGWQAQAYSQQTLFENLQQGGIISPDRDFDAERAAIQTESPFGQVVGLDQE